jgi:hypothetical protein
MTATTRTSQRTGPCVFCDQVGVLSEEDLFPMWAGRVLRDLANGKVDVVMSTRQLDVDGTLLRHEHQRRQTFSAIKLDGVCKTCNSGWMSQIEEAAKPLVEPMIRNIRTGIPFRHLDIIARWLTLKTLVADLIPHGYPTATPDDYHAFYTDPNPPDGFMAVLGRVDLKGRQDSYNSLQPLRAAQTRDGVTINDPLALKRLSGCVS